MLGLVETKVISLVVMGVASLVLGLLPLRLARRRGTASSTASSEDSSSCPRHAAAAGPLLTALLSFGAGALLATALVHMLPEASEEMPKAAPVALLVGFLVLYLIDEVVQRILGHSPAAARAHRAHPHPACPVDKPCVSPGSLLASKSLGSGRRERDYGSLDESASYSRGRRPSPGVEAVALLPEETCRVSGPSGACLGPQASHSAGAATGAGAGGASCWGLLLALSIHSIIEGLAVGLEETPQRVLFLLGAVSSHKLVVSFCLGAELVGGGVSLLPHLVAVLVFSMGSAAGVGLGMALFGMPDVFADAPLLPVLQAAAAGTLLYVTLAEVLPRERARSQTNFPRRVMQFVAFTVGAVLITSLVTFIDDHNGPVEGPLGPAR